MLEKIIHSINNEIKPLAVIGKINGLDYEEDRIKQLEREINGEKAVGNIINKWHNEYFYRLNNLALRMDKRSLFQFQVYNLLPYSRNMIIFCEILIPSKNITIYSSEGNKVEFEIVRLERVEELNCFRASLNLKVMNLEPMGYDTFTVEEEETVHEVLDLYSGDNYIESTKYKLQVVKDKEKNKTIINLYDKENDYYHMDLLSNYNDIKIISTQKSQLSQDIIISCDKNTKKLFFHVDNLSSNIKCKVKLNSYNDDKLIINLEEGVEAVRFGLNDNFLKVHDAQDIIEDANLDGEDTNFNYLTYRTLESQFQIVSNDIYEIELEDHCEISLLLNGENKINGEYVTEFFISTFKIDEDKYKVDRTAKEATSNFILFQEKMFNEDLDAYNYFKREKDVEKNNQKYLKRNLPIKKSFLEIKSREIILTRFEKAKKSNAIVFTVFNSGEENIKMMLQSYFSHKIIDNDENIIDVENKLIFTKNEYKSYISVK